MGRLTNGFLEANNFRGEVLIETGTDKGKGPAFCKSLFQQIHTIELDPARYEAAKKRLAKIKNVTCHHGHSPEILHDIIDRSRKTVFWLDAHYVATDPAAQHVEGQCPLIGELNAIFAAPWDDQPTILIDDARMFTDWFWGKGESKGYDRAQWPKTAEILALAEQNGYGMRQIGDVLILEAAVPAPTKADDLIDSARKHVCEAVQDLSDVITGHCDGVQAWDSGYRATVEEALQTLTRLKRDL